jgi:hypothetical protein
MRKGGGMRRKVCFFILLFIALLYWAGGIRTPSWSSGPGGNPSLFPEISRWKRSGEIQIFFPRNLYNYIDGGAELYLKYDFQELEVAEYLNDKKASVTVEIYRHKTPTDAFGIYSQERLANAKYLAIGAQGYSEENILNFVLGNYYVKMNSFNTGPEDQEVLVIFAKRVAEKLGGNGSLPSIFSSFPKEGKKENSEKFIAKSFLGYSSLHSGFTADYELSGKKFQLFVIEGEDQNDCRNMIQEYLQRTGNLGKRIEEGHFTVKDPYQGEIDFCWKGKYIWGALNLDEPTIRAKYLKLFEEGLPERK